MPEIIGLVAVIVVADVLAVIGFGGLVRGRAERSHADRSEALAESARARHDLTPDHVSTARRAATSSVWA